MKRIVQLFLAGYYCLMISIAVAEVKLPQEVQINGVEFVHVPAGEFYYAIPAGRVSHDNHMNTDFRNVKVWQDGFYIAKYEIRADDFLNFMSAKDRPPELDDNYAEGDGAEAGCSVRRNQQDEYYLVRPEDDLPATHLSWELANEMAQWMGFRLPTDAEWVKAARGTDQRIWPWGNEYPDDTFAGYSSGSPCHPTPVDQYPNGASPYGAYGMAGGVFEYVADWYNIKHFQNLSAGDRNPVSKEALPARSDTTGEMNPLKMMRGGRWASGATSISVYRFSHSEAEIAFRCYGARFAVDESEVIKILAESQTTQRASE
jgi:iron(II)-dependent oxidoreductase